MLPVIDMEIYEKIIKDALGDIKTWRKKMIHYIKEENPEINTAIIDLAQKTDLDPKAVATGAYITYLLLEKASEEKDDLIDFDE